MGNEFFMDSENSKEKFGKKHEKKNTSNSKKDWTVRETLKGFQWGKINLFSSFCQGFFLLPRALFLASPEVRFNIDSETHDPIDVQTKELKYASSNWPLCLRTSKTFAFRETNFMVEEFMLLANISVAEKIQKEFPEYSLLRRHPAPPLSSYDPVMKAAQSKVGFWMKKDNFV
jgi:hypothetical protein